MPKHVCWRFIAWHSDRTGLVKGARRRVGEGGVSDNHRRVAGAQIDDVAHPAVRQALARLQKELGRAWVQWCVVVAVRVWGGG